VSFNIRGMSVIMSYTIEISVESYGNIIIYDAHHRHRKQMKRQTDRLPHVRFVTRETHPRAVSEEMYMYSVIDELSSRTVEIRENTLRLFRG